MTDEQRSRRGATTPLPEGWGGIRTNAAIEDCFSGSQGKFLPHLQKAKADNLNEADTVQRLVKVFEEVLG